MRGPFSWAGTLGQCDEKMVMVSEYTKEPGLWRRVLQMFLVIGSLGCSDDPVEAVMPMAGREAELAASCSRCHRNPSPQVLPRAAWQEAIEKMYRFVGAEGQRLDGFLARGGHRLVRAAGTATVGDHT